MFINSRIALSATIFIAFSLMPTARAATILSADFDSAFFPLGWATRNVSTPTPDKPWGIRTNSDPFTGQGGTGGFAFSDFESVTNSAGQDNISNWLLTPEIALENGTQVSFYTRTRNPQVFGDTLIVRYSTAGASTNVGTGGNVFGDFVNTLVSVNPTGLNNGFPTDWTQFTSTITGLALPTTGRIAFHNFIVNGGPGGANSDFIGVDTVRVTSGAVAVPESGAGILTLLGMTVCGYVVRRRK